jgi:hypothetical protein
VFDVVDPHTQLHDPVAKVVKSASPPGHLENVTRKFAIGDVM